MRAFASATGLGRPAASSPKNAVINATVAWLPTGQCDTTRLRAPAYLIDSRLAQGTFFRAPSAVWFRLRHPLVAGEDPTPIQRVAVAADSGNGISAILDFSRYTFLNSDLTINLLRRPQGEWICIDAQTLLGPQGGGVAEARIFDASGLVGRSTQSLLVRLRD